MIGSSTVYVTPYQNGIILFETWSDEAMLCFAKGKGFQEAKTTSFMGTGLLVINREADYLYISNKKVWLDYHDLTKFKLSKADCLKKFKYKQKDSYWPYSVASL